MAHSRRPVVFLEIGDRSAGDGIQYPDDDIPAVFRSDGTWSLRTRTAGRTEPYRGR